MKVKLHDIVNQNKLEEIEIFLRENMKELDLRDKYGQTALMKAVNKGFEKIVIHLLKVGANTNVTDLLRTSPLHIALKKGFYEIAYILVDYGADINLCNIDGKNPIELCTSKEVVAMLKERHESRCQSLRDSSTNNEFKDSSSPVNDNNQPVSEILISNTHNEDKNHSSKSQRSRLIRRRSIRKLGETEFTINYHGNEVRMLRRSNSFTKGYLNSKKATEVVNRTPIPVLGGRDTLTYPIHMLRRGSLDDTSKVGREVSLKTLVTWSKTHNTTTANSIQNTTLTTSVPSTASTLYGGRTADGNISSEDPIQAELDGMGLASNRDLSSDVIGSVVNGDVDGDIDVTNSNNEVMFIIKESDTNSTNCIPIPAELQVPFLWQLPSSQSDHESFYESYNFSSDSTLRMQTQSDVDTSNTSYLDFFSYDYSLESMKKVSEKSQQLQKELYLSNLLKSSQTMNQKDKEAGLDSNKTLEMKENNGLIINNEIQISFDNNNNSNNSELFDNRVYDSNGIGDDSHRFAYSNPLNSRTNSVIEYRGVEKGIGNNLSPKRHQIRKEESIGNPGQQSLFNLFGFYSRAKYIRKSSRSSSSSSSPSKSKGDDGQEVNHVSGDSRAMVGSPGSESQRKRSSESESSGIFHNIINLINAPMRPHDRIGPVLSTNHKPPTHVCSTNVDDSIGHHLHVTGLVHETTYLRCTDLIYLRRQVVAYGAIPTSFLENGFPSLHAAVVVNDNVMMGQSVLSSTNVNSEEVTLKLRKDLSKLKEEYDLLSCMQKISPTSFIRPLAVVDPRQLYVPSASGSSDDNLILLEGYHGLLMEKIEMSLETFLLSSRDVRIGSFKSRLAVAYRVIDIVRLAHQNGWVLGDIQLSSFVVTRDPTNESPLIKYSGLDAMKKIGSPIEPIYQGNIANLSPEYAKGHVTIAEPTQDLWALGMTVLQILSNESEKSFWSFGENISTSDIVKKYLMNATQLWVDNCLQLQLGESFKSEYGFLLKGLLQIVPSLRMQLKELCEDFAELRDVVDNFRLSLSFGYNIAQHSNVCFDSASGLQELIENRNSNLMHCKHYFPTNKIATSTLQSHLEYHLSLPLTILTIRNQIIPSHFLLIPIRNDSHPSLLSSFRYMYTKTITRISTEGSCHFDWDLGKLALIAIDPVDGRYLQYGKSRGFEFSLAHQSSRGRNGNELTWGQFANMNKILLSFLSIQLAILLRLFPNLKMEDMIPPKYLDIIPNQIKTPRDIEKEYSSTFPHDLYKYLDSVWLEVNSINNKHMMLRIEGIPIERLFTDFIRILTANGFNYSLLTRRERS